MCVYVYVYTSQPNDNILYLWHNYRWRHNTQYSDSQHNDTQQNGLYFDTYHNNTLA
jgi:hypothetical protein